MAKKKGVLQMGLIIIKVFCVGFLFFFYTCR